MLFLGTFMGNDEYSLPCTPSCCCDITRVSLMNGKFQRFFVTRNVADALSPSFPEDWDFDTIMYARFDKNSSNAGNVDWRMNQISHLLIKRKEADSFHWTTIAVKDIVDDDDFVIMGTDYTNSAKTNYEYAVVPSFYGIEGNYDAAGIYSDFEDIFIIGRNGAVCTSLGNCYLDMTNTAPSSTLTTLNSKYPTIVRNTAANYKTGSFTGNFAKLDETTGDYLVDDKNVTDCQNQVIAFLSDGSPKLLKHFDGRTLLINIDSDITNNADGHYRNRVLSFHFTEIGDNNSPKALYDSGLTDVTEEWWDN